MYVYCLLEIYMWWKDSIVYRIDPRSFQDSDDDGMGDVKGITKRMDYIKHVGFNTILLSPMLQPGSVDHIKSTGTLAGFPQNLGSIQDIHNMIQTAHDHDLKIIFCLVLSNTSIDHPWFEAAVADRNSKFSSFYIFCDEIPNNWINVSGKKAWSFEERRKQYYHHSYNYDSADLNWRNPELGLIMEEYLAYWLDSGVDGFYLQDINTLIKDDALRDNPTNFGVIRRRYERQEHVFDRNRSETHLKLERLRNVVNRYEDRILIGRLQSPDAGEPELSASYLGVESEKMHLVVDRSITNTRFTANRIALSAKRLYEAIGSSRTPVWELTDGSRSRILNRCGKVEALARLAALFQLTQRGMIILYYGQELGLPDSKLPFYKRLFRKKQEQRALGPMIWSTGEGSGFSMGEPWIPFARGANRLSVENQLLEEGSILQLYRALIELRNRCPALRRGVCSFIETSDPHMLVYARETEEESYMILLNFNERYQNLAFKDFEVRGTVVFSTLRGIPNEGGRVVLEELGPYEGVILRLDSETEE